MVKVTFTLDDETILRLKSVAEGLGKPKSEVVREAIAEYHDRLGQLSEAEKRRMLRAFDEMLPLVPRRPASSVDREIEQVRAARSSGRDGGAR